MPAADPSPRPLIIKICGITRVEDGLCALNAGADWLGFIRWPNSARFQPIQSCADLILALRDATAKSFKAVGVYVDAPVEQVLAEAARLGLDRIQLHGSESPAYLKRIEWPVLKTIRINGPTALELAKDYPGVDLLADAFDPVSPGGTGIVYDYSLLRDLAASRRVMVAGGLDADNVAGVVRDLRPWGVDVASKLEAEPGIKDHRKVRAFVAAARAAAAGD